LHGLPIGNRRYSRLGNLRYDCAGIAVHPTVQAVKPGEQKRCSRLESPKLDFRNPKEIRNPNAAIAHFPLNSSPGQRSSN
jgi:hypothetical protein